MKNVLPLLLLCSLSAFAQSTNYFPIRNVGGTNYDISATYSWSRNRPRNVPYGSANKNPDPRWRKITGKILRVLDGSVIVKSYSDDKQLAITNLPNFKDVVDGQLISVFAIRVGVKKYDTILGTSTVPLYDHGTISTNVPKK